MVLDGCRVQIQVTDFGNRRQHSHHMLSERRCTSLILFTKCKEGLRQREIILRTMPLMSEQQWSQQWRNRCSPRAALPQASFTTLKSQSSNGCGKAPETMEGGVNVCTYIDEADCKLLLQGESSFLKLGLSFWTWGWTYDKCLSINGLFQIFSMVVFCLEKNACLQTTDVNSSLTLWFVSFLDMSSSSRRHTKWEM